MSCPSAQVLDLSNNNISQIDGEALAPLYSLAILALEGNNLRQLKFKTFVSLHTTATHITLSGLQQSAVLSIRNNICLNVTVTVLYANLGISSQVSSNDTVHTLMITSALLFSYPYFPFRSNHLPNYL